MWQSTQVSQRGSRLQSASLGVGFQLGLHISRTVARLGDCFLSRRKTPFLPWEERCGCAPQEPAGFGDSKRGRVPDPEMLSHRLGEHGVRMETRETGVTDCFSLKAH